MKQFRTRYTKCLWLFILLTAAPVWGELNVVTTTEDLRSIAQAVGGNKVNVQSLAKGHQDTHYISARPDFIVKASKADVLIQIGMDLEIGWVPLLVRQARNEQISIGEIGRCNASAKVKRLEVPEGEISRQMGDVHVYGNPHYWTDPVNGILIAKKIADCFSKVDPANKAAYQKGYQSFSAKMKKKLVGWLKMFKPLAGSKVIGYHKEFVYIAQRFNLKLVDHIEGKPGVAPGPGRMAELASRIKSEKVKAILATPWNNLSYAQTLSRETGVPLIVLPIQTGANEEIPDYDKMMDVCLKKLKQGLSK